MSIKIKNIKCYENIEYNFGEDGLVLISGNSGKGKSTILQAIYFALFGTGSKIIMVGKNSCSVEFKFDGIKIFRSKNPSKLIVNDIYEEEEAQQIIFKKFGSTFDVTGYIPQNAMKSFAVMSSSDKLAFLERFAFENCDLGVIKNKCKEKINIKHDELISINSKLETTIEMFEDIEEPEFVEFPVKLIDDDYTKSIKKEYSRYNILIEKIKEKSETNQTKNNLLLRIKNSRDTVTKNELHIKELTNKLDDIKIKLQNTGPIVDTIKLSKEEELLNNIKTNKEFINLTNEYNKNVKYLEEIISNESKSIDKELKDVTSELWLMYSENEVKEMIEENEIIMTDLKQILSLEKKLTVKPDSDTIQMTTEVGKLKTVLENIIFQSKVHSCPSCNTKLRFKNGTLVHDNELPGDTIDLTEDEIKDKISIIENNIKNIKEIKRIQETYEDLPSIKDVSEDLKYLREYYAENKQVEKTKIQLEYKANNNVFSKTCENLKKTVKQQQEKLTELKKSMKTLTVDISEDELQNSITSKRELLLNQNHLISNIKQVETDLARYNAYNIESVKSILKNVDCDIISELTRMYNDCTRDIESNKNDIDVMNSKKEKHEYNIKQIKKWEQMMTDLETYNRWQENVNDLQKKETNTRHEYTALCTLKEKILEAESLAIINVVEIINTHARIYLEKFFENEPISVELKAFKNNKKTTKAQITMDIQYKGMDCDLNMMSGGETSRIILAYTLALAEMFNTPLIMLDECTASLDQETADDVFEAIRENFNGKLTIIIAHQVVTGTFDHTINL